MAMWDKPERWRLADWMKWHLRLTESLWGLQFWTPLLPPHNKQGIAMHGERKAAGLLYRTKGSVRKTAHECSRRARVVKAESMSANDKVFSAPSEWQSSAVTATPKTVSSHQALQVIPQHGFTRSNNRARLRLLKTREHKCDTPCERGGWGLRVMRRPPRCHHRVASAQTDKEAVMPRMSPLLKMLYHRINGSITPLPYDFRHLITGSNTWRSNNSIPT